MIMLERSKYARANKVLGHNVESSLGDSSVLTVHYIDGSPWSKEKTMKENGVWHVDDNKNCLK